MPIDMTSQVRARLRVVGYLRVSTKDQADDGLGLDVQEAAIRSRIRKDGHRLVGMVEDAGRSGTLDALDREGLAEALSMIQAGQADALMIHRLDRVARTLTVQEATLGIVWRHGGKVLTVDGEVERDNPDDPMRTAMRQMMGVFAQLELAMITKRMRDGRRLKGDKGGYAYGAPPFGWRSDDGDLVPVDAEQEAIACIAKHHALGWSLRAIARHLETEGHRAKRGGGRWHPQTVSDVVARLESA